MAYLPDSIPVVPPPEENEPFWSNCRARRLTFQRCNACGSVIHPPVGVCPACQSLDRGWIDAPSEGTIFSFTWTYAAGHPSVRTSLPYNVAIIEFPALPGVRLVSNVIDVQPGDIRIGDVVQLTWEKAGTELLPRFRLQGSG